MTDTAYLNRTCDKCGSPYIKCVFVAEAPDAMSRMMLTLEGFYHRRKKHEPPLEIRMEPEHLALTCGVCDHTWSEEPMDAVKEAE